MKTIGNADDSQLSALSAELADLAKQFPVEIGPLSYDVALSKESQYLMGLRYGISAAAVQRFISATTD